MSDMRATDICKFTTAEEADSEGKRSLQFHE